MSWQDAFIFWHIIIFITRAQRHCLHPCKCDISIISNCEATTKVSKLSELVVIVLFPVELCRNQNWQRQINWGLVSADCFEQWVKDVEDFNIVLCELVVVHRSFNSKTILPDTGRGISIQEVSLRKRFCMDCILIDIICLVDARSSSTIQFTFSF
jgi:hypothetical protein